MLVRSLEETSKNAPGGLNMSADNFFMNTVLGGRVGDTFKQVPAANMTADAIDINFNDHGLANATS
jgi:hypothetical protein